LSIAASLVVHAALAGGAEASLGKSRELFPPATRVEGETLERTGVGVLKYKRLIPVYDAALYLGEGTLAEEALKDVPKRIEVHYRVSADADRFAAAGEKILQKGFEAEEIRQVKDRVDRINSWYPDPQPGDRCSITYLPGRGTELVYNGRSLGVIEGADFARVYFAIWLGEKPASTSLRDDLLNVTSKRSQRRS
jgi:hypothetical protein